MMQLAGMKIIATQLLPSLQIAHDLFKKDFYLTVQYLPRQQFSHSVSF